MILDEERFSSEHVTGNRQEDLVKEYCANVEEETRTAHSASEARNHIMSACERFASECDSVLLTSTLRRRLDSMFEKYWKGQ